MAVRRPGRRHRQRPGAALTRHRTPRTQIPHPRPAQAQRIQDESVSTDRLRLPSESAPLRLESPGHIATAAHAAEPAGRQLSRLGLKPYPLAVAGQFQVAAPHQPPLFVERSHRALPVDRSRAPAAVVFLVVHQRLQA